MHQCDNQIHVLQLERKIVEISELVQKYVTPKIESLFGVNVRSIDITEIVVDKTSRGYRELKAVTTDLEKDTLQTRSSLNLDAMKRQQEMSLGGQGGDATYAVGASARDYAYSA